MNSELGSTSVTGPSLELYLDHACPWSALAFSATRAVAAALDLAPRWRLLPITGPREATPAEAAMHRQRRQAEWPAVQAAADLFDRRLQAPDPNLDGLRSAALIARLRQQVPAIETDLHAAIYRAAFQSGLDIGDISVLRTVLVDRAEEAGEWIDIDSAMRAMDSRIESILARDRRAAGSAGVTAVPTLVLAGSHLLVGAEPPAVLHRAIESFRGLADAARKAGDRISTRPK